MSRYTLVIGNKNYSSWSLRPWIWLRQCEIEFREKRIALFTDSYKQELQPYFSGGKVPVLLDGDLTIWDSLAILEYLAEQHVDARGWPEESRARVVARSVSAEMHAGFAALRGALPMNCRKHFLAYAITDAVQQDINRVTALWTHCRQHYGAGGGWLFGEFSIADAMYAPVVLRFHGYDVSLPGVAGEYVQYVLKNRYIQEWMEAGRQETDIIAEDEV